MIFSKVREIKYIFSILSLLFPILLFSQENVKEELAYKLNNFAKQYASVGKIRIVKIVPNKRDKTVTITDNNALSYLPLRENMVDSIYLIAKELMEQQYPNYGLVIMSDQREISALVPGVYRANHKSLYKRFSVQKEQHPLVKNLSTPYKLTGALSGRHIAVWHSHGKYYNQKTQKWNWQRPILFTTLEDLYTRSYVVPFLVPMLENAGANVLLPRERDTHSFETIIDDNGSTHQSLFIMKDGKQKWHRSEMGEGFANAKETYKDGENPFSMGTYYYTSTTTNNKQVAVMKYIPNMEEKGEYAVYVSYKSLPNSTPTALYKVKHLGGETTFEVNQTMGGGTWIYLGTFMFPKGLDNRYGVFLYNYSKDKTPKMVTADAVKIGGGVGNIIRKPADRVVKKRIKRRGKYRYIRKTVKYDNYSSSHLPRFAEGSRYWLQWAGVPDSVYSRTEGSNDYSDDFQSRGFWVNYLAGGSSIMPKSEGLRIPIDLSLALHSDAGIRHNDSIIGTLAIFTERNTAGKYFYENGISRRNAREYADIVQSEILRDVKSTFKKDWNRRGMWNRSYSESRTPEVPTLLLEVLSHQNFADMQFGLEPTFRFVVSRAIYKGMLKYISLANGTKYIVQPLPVNEFYTKFVGKDSVELNWQPTHDKLEPTAKPSAYVVYTKVGSGDYDNGVLVRSNTYSRPIDPNKIYTFKVAALNAGGRSFPSEELSVCHIPNRPTVLIMNGFTKVSAPHSFREGSTIAGFNEEVAAAIPYISDTYYVGKQTEFRRFEPFVDIEDAGFGKCDTTYRAKVLAGNTFNYPLIHGEAFQKANCSFVSTSKKAVINGKVDFTQYQIVDLIMGKQRQKTDLMDSTKTNFKVFDKELRREIKRYCKAGGNLLISGSNIVTDMVRAKDANIEDKKFLVLTLHTKWISDKINNVQNVTFTSNTNNHFKLQFYAQPNSKSYYVEAPDVIVPANKQSIQLCRYGENGLGAGVAYRGDYRVVILGFPIEAVTIKEKKEHLIKNIVHFFSEKRLKD